MSAEEPAINPLAPACKGLQAEVRERCDQVAAGANKEAGLHELDAMVRNLVLSLGDRVMAQAVAQVAEGPTAPVPCPQGKRAMVFKQWRSMTIRRVTTGRALRCSYRSTGGMAALHKQFQLRMTA